MDTVVASHWRPGRSVGLWASHISLLLADRVVISFASRRLRFAFIGLILGVVGMLAGWFVAFLRTWLQGGAANPQLDYVVLTNAPWIAKFTMGFLIIVALPFAEEVLYRGVLYDALERIRGPQFAIWMSSAIFGLMHFDISISGATAFLGLIYAV